MKKNFAEFIRTVQLYLRRLAWKQRLLVGVGALAALLLVVQILYPPSRALPLTSIGGVSLGWQTKDAARQTLDKAYSGYKATLVRESTGNQVATPSMSEIGAQVNSQPIVDGLSYPWYLRLVPSSLLWGQYVETTVPEVKFTDSTVEYVDQKLMPYCQKKPVDATLKAEKGVLKVAKAVPGGQCKQAEALAALKAVQPQLGAKALVKLPVKEIAPSVSDKTAQAKADTYNARLKSGVPLQIGTQQISVPAETAASWLVFTAKDNTLVLTVDPSKAQDYVAKTISPKVAVAAGVSYIKTRDFTETSRINGATGRTLDIGATLESVRAYLDNQLAIATAATQPVPPREEYTRTYSPTDAGLSALLANFAKDHPGSYGMSLIELGGQKRRASYQGDKQFVTASTYKLFAAYSLLKRIDAGSESWVANSDCFNRMLTNSDNPCAEAYLEKLGLTAITNDIQAIGLSSKSNFTVKGGPFTTADDLALLLGQLQTGQNFSSTNRTRMLDAMKANIFRQGIPSGTSAVVADKVGFLDGLLHDAGIVYSPSGTYVLVILSDGSSWANLADLTRQVEKLRGS